MLNLICDFASVMQTIGNVLLAFVVLMVMVLIHETGHYTAGKIFKFQINEFSIGMGPKIFSKVKKNGETVSLRAFPLGGFCAFEGENAETENPHAFNKQKPWKRLIVLFSGAFFNFISAIIIAVIVFSAYGDTVAVVARVYDYAPETNRQLQSGDIIYKINGKRVFILDDIGRYMKDGEMQFTVLRPTEEDGKTVYKQYEVRGVIKNDYVSAAVTKVDGEYKSLSGNRVLAAGDMIYKIDGKSLSKNGDFENYLAVSGDTLRVTVAYGSEIYEYDIPKSIFQENKIVVKNSEYSGVGMSVNYAAHKFGFGESLLRSVPYCGEVGMLVLRTLGGLITGAVGIDQVGGPITTIGMTSQVVATGFGNILRLIVLISVNLAVFNLLPVPALDGCQMIFVIIEWIRRKPVNQKVQGYINGIGLIALIALMILVDILKL